MMQIFSFVPYAVITGDFIGFSPLSAEVRKELYGLVKRSGSRLNQVFGRRMAGRLAMFRGDAWQMLFADPSAALRAGLLFRALVRAGAPLSRIDVRMAIGVGTVDYVPKGHVSAGDGEAFRRSGKLLEAMTTPRAGTLRFDMADARLCPIIDGLAVLAGGIAETWTPMQARAVSGALAGMTQKQIAGAWEGGISFQAVSRHLQRAGWPALRHAIYQYEAVMGRPAAD